MAEPNVPGKPTAGTKSKMLLAILIISLLMVWMTCAGLGLAL